MHEQISYKGNGVYQIKGLSQDDSDFSFADIESSLLNQHFEHIEFNEKNTDRIGLVDIEESTCSIVYDLEEDVAELYFTELSSTKEKVLDEALTAGHVPEAYSLRDLYKMETDEEKEVYMKGTEEYYNAWED